MLKILLLGSTGSIGTSACRCAERFHDHFELVGLSANNNGERLIDQIKTFSPKAVCIADPSSAKAHEKEIPSSVAFYSDTEGLLSFVRDLDYDILLNAIVGAAGFRPTVEALARGKRVALANKESLVIGGEYIGTILSSGKGEIIPVDSEHSAIFQCLQGEKIENVESIILTASGGPFRELPPERFEQITPRDALNHPTWEMGAKITIDSATLINKGFEVIEAHHLFGLPYDRIRVWIHPQSVIHSMIEMHDGAVLSQMGVPDMELPIQYALSYPERMPLGEKRLTLSNSQSLTFTEPDYARFPCLKLCQEAGKAGGTAPVVLNAANEIAVQLFLQQKIRFNDIARIIQQALDEHYHEASPVPERIEEVDALTRNAITKRY
ncbi:MAG: 1-deoxy-D-xylulose-5-phosphate reductoisomerase [Chitinivibrionales bacterium]|nr:1-deoxy-D-xylulose-5-phosphate reductoisomerase [Chitinivibrionales bacterium]